MYVCVMAYGIYEYSLEEIRTITLMLTLPYVYVSCLRQNSLEKAEVVSTIGVLEQFSDGSKLNQFHPYPYAVYVLHVLLLLHARSPRQTHYTSFDTGIEVSWRSVVTCVRL